ncbi:MAG: Nif11-like leader peptide family RiPP precursor [Actinomycetes bacterium]
MSREQLDALNTATTTNDELRSTLETAATLEDFVRIANENGFGILIEDLPPADEDADVSDAELAGVSGGYTFPPTDWIYCANPWTNVYCTLKC